MIFFTADTHFGSERALKLSRRPFSSVLEMDRYMVDRWNEVVRKDDTVYHLGDFGELNVRTRLNGKINLLLGNYERDYLEKSKDGVSENDSRLAEFRFNRRMDALKNTFDEIMPFDSTAYSVTDLLKENRRSVQEVIDFLRLSKDDSKLSRVENLIIHLMHEPSHAIKSEEFIFNLYGHIHGRQMIRPYGMDVGVDAHHFRPISLNDVFFYWTAIQYHYDDEVFDGLSPKQIREAAQVPYHGQ